MSQTTAAPDVFVGSDDDDWMSDPDFLITVARRYCPVFYLHPDEPFLPIDINDLVRASYLKCMQTGQVVEMTRCGIDPLLLSEWMYSQPTPPAVGGGLTSAAAQGTVDDVKRTQGYGYTMALIGGDASHLLKQQPRDGRLDKMPLYVHWRRSDEHDRNVLITFMHCYAYNGATDIWRRIDNHMADLEYVTIDVRCARGGATALTRVFFSQHAGGQWVPFANLCRDLVDPERFAAFVAMASHASYPTSGDKRRYLGIATDRCQWGTMQPSNRQQQHEREMMSAAGSSSSSSSSSNNNNNMQNHRWDARDSLVFLNDDCCSSASGMAPSLARSQLWMRRFVGQLGDGSVQSFAAHSVWQHTDEDGNSGGGCCWQWKCN